MFRFRKRNDCKKITELLSAYIDKQLSSPESDLVHKHIQSCQKCSQELETLTKTVKLLHRTQVEQVPHSFTVADIQPIKRPVYLGVMRFAAVISAAIVVILFLADALNILNPSVPVPLTPTPIIYSKPAPTAILSITATPASTPTPTKVGAVTRTPAPTATPVATRTATPAPIKSGSSPAPEVTPAPAPGMVPESTFSADKMTQVGAAGGKDVSDSTDKVKGEQGTAEVDQSYSVEKEENANQVQTQPTSTVESPGLSTTIRKEENRWWDYLKFSLLGFTIVIALTSFLVWRKWKHENKYN